MKALSEMQPATTPAPGQRETASVATAHPDATAAGTEILRRGGNAVDAAVAAGFALAVCEPSGSGLGGQAVALLHHPRHGEQVFDGHSHGPASLRRSQITRAEQRRGHKACTIPSMPATLAALHRKHGRLALAEVLSPAVRLAADGIVVSKLLRRHIQWCRQALAASTAADVFLPGGKPPRVGALLRQPALARTLTRMAANDVEDFYRGSLAADIVHDQQAHGGFIEATDLAELAMPVLRAPIAIPYRGHWVMSVPPPGGGLQLLLGLKLADALNVSQAPSEEERYTQIALIVHAIFRERVEWPLQPERVTPSLIHWLLSSDRAAEMAERIRREPPRMVASSEGPGDTTHLCVADSDGMVVSLTQSIQSLFGAKVLNERLGFFYNNYLTTCPRYRHPSRLRGGAMPQSNAAPTFVFGPGDTRPRLALGAAGSRRITSSLLQVLLHVMDDEMPIASALDAPRIHVTLSRRPMVESRIATPALESCLAPWFRPSDRKASRSYAMGAVQAVAREDSGWIGAADPRREGTADGI